MLSFLPLNQIWEKSVRSHATSVLQGDRGPYLPVGGKTLAFLDCLWKEPLAFPLPDLGAMIEEGKIIRFWSDPHFQHANIINLCQRPFSDVQIMDSTIRTNLKAAFAQSDMVVCVGDLSLKDALHEHRTLVNHFGEKHLHILGNHDIKGATPEQWKKAGAVASLAFSLPTKLIKQWLDADFPSESACLEWDKLPVHINFGMCHWPMPASRLPGKGWLSIHGHIHDKPGKPLGLNTSVEAIDYAPKTLRELLTVEKIDNLITYQKNPEAFNKAEVAPESAYL